MILECNSWKSNFFSLQSLQFSSENNALDDTRTQEGLTTITIETYDRKEYKPRRNIPCRHIIILPMPTATYYCMRYFIGQAKPRSLELFWFYSLHLSSLTCRTTLLPYCSTGKDAPCSSSKRFMTTKKLGLFLQFSRLSLLHCELDRRFSRLDYRRQHETLHRGKDEQKKTNIFCSNAITVAGGRWMDIFRGPAFGLSFALSLFFSFSLSFKPLWPSFASRDSVALSLVKKAFPFYIFPTGKVSSAGERELLGVQGWTFWHIPARLLTLLLNFYLATLFLSSVGSSLCGLLFRVLVTYVVWKSSWE